MNSVLASVGPHRGQWTMVALLNLIIVFVSATAGPTIAAMEDKGLRHTIESAPYTARDLILTQQLSAATDVSRLRDDVSSILPPPLRSVTDSSWGFQYTQVAPEAGLALSLAGPGVRTDPDGVQPIVALHHQSDLDEHVTLVAGAAPASDTTSGVIEFMTAAKVADALGVAVGGEYTLGEVTARMSGIFVPDDAADPVWHHTPWLREPGHISLNCAPCIRAIRAALATDQEAFETLFAHGMAAHTEPLAGVRTRLDARGMEAGQAATLAQAVARVESEPQLQHMSIRTRLGDLFGEFQRQAAAARAVAAVVAAGVVTILLALLVMAARLSAERRRGELTLLRARGASAAQVLGGLAAAALPWAGAAAAAGWGLSRLVAGEHFFAPAPELALAAVLALLGWLVVPAAALTVTGAMPGGLPATLGRFQTGPVRATAELALVVLAAASLVLIHQRGLKMAGVDPLLSAAPGLAAVVVGVVALRCYRWPLRALLALVRRGRGALAFLGTARVARNGSGPTAALLVLVLAVSLGGFAAAMSVGVSQARDEAAVRDVGAHARVSLTGTDRLPVGVVEAVEAVPGVEGVAVAQRGGVVREAPVRHGEALPRRDMQGPGVVTVDIAAYARVLAALGVEVDLPAALRSRASETEPVPVLAPPQVADRNEPTIEVDGVERRVSAVGGVNALPGPDRGSTWVLVPEDAWPSAGTEGTARRPARVSGYELLVAGESLDTTALRATAQEFDVRNEVEVTTLAGHRARLGDSGFNSGLSVLLAAGAAFGVVGCIVVLALSTMLHAGTRSTTLSLLRTMGMSQQRVRLLLLVEQLPAVAVGVAAGAAAGASMPSMFGDALGTAEFTGGFPPALGVEPAIIVAFVLLAATLTAAAVAIEAGITRRLHSGGTLRFD